MILLFCGMILPPEIMVLIASLQRELETLRAENAELRRRLGLDSWTSSKPPSSDGLKKKPVSLREPSGRPSGGQKGHKGETLRQVAEPDRIVTHAAPACRHWGCALSAAMTAGVERRQVFCSSWYLICRSGCSRSSSIEALSTPAPAAAGAPGRPFRPKRNMASASGLWRSISTPSTPCSKPNSCCLGRSPKRPRSRSTWPSSSTICS